MQWFRLYNEFAHDPVIQSLAFEDQRHYVVILCLKSEGLLDRAISAQARNRIILKTLGLDVTAADQVKRRLQEVDLVDKNWQPKGWSKRQFESDDATKRTRKYRKNNGSGNVPETATERTGNSPDTDTDTDTEKRSHSSSSWRDPSKVEDLGSTHVVEPREKSLARPRADVHQVFEHWRQVHDHPSAKLDPKRQRVIANAIKLGYSADDLCEAIDGCKLSPFHQGQNDRHTVYDDIALICRDAEHVDRFRRIARAPPARFVSEVTNHNVAVMEDWIHGRH